ncbi:MAG: ribbon-helix-helix protein, CopG family [Actinomycetota bacterium]
MGKAISVRLDDEAFRALALLEATGLTRSEAIRKALKQSSDLIRRRESLAEESRALEADAADRREMLEVAELMESLRAEG